MMAFNETRRHEGVYMKESFTIVETDWNVKKAIDVTGITMETQ